MRGLRTRIETFRGEYDTATAEYKALTQCLEALKKDLEGKELEMNKMAPLVFISYAREDYARVVEIDERLKQQGLSTTLLDRQIYSGI